LLALDTRAVFIPPFCRNTVPSRITGRVRSKATPPCPPYSRLTPDRFPNSFLCPTPQSAFSFPDLKNRGQHSAVCSIRPLCMRSPLTEIFYSSPRSSSGFFARLALYAIFLSPAAIRVRIFFPQNRASARFPPLHATTFFLPLAPASSSPPVPEHVLPKLPS